jgi:hypothetical protein
MTEGFAAVVLAAVVGAVLGSVSAHEHFRRARVRSRLALVALVSAIVLVGGTSALAVALFAGAALGTVVEIFRPRGAPGPAPDETAGVGPASAAGAAGVEASGTAPR